MSQPPPEVLLQKVLAEERRQGFGNRAMIGGLSAFARALHSQAAGGSPIPEAALLLAHYDEDDVLARQGAVAAATSVLNRPPSTCREDFSATTTDRDEDLPPAKPSRVASRVRSASRGQAVKASPSVDGASLRARASTSGPVLDQSVRVLQGIGDKRAAELAAVGLATVGNVLYYFPREHIDYRSRDRIQGLRLGEPTTLLARVEGVRVRRLRKNLSITTVIVSDATGRVPVEWFNQPYLEKTFRVGRQIALSGELDLFGERRVFKPRDYEWIDEEDLTHAGRLVPIYPLRKGLHQKSLRSLIHHAVDGFAAQVSDPLPEYIRSKFDLSELSTALSDYHFPEEETDAARGRRRLAFDEILSIQLGLRLRKRDWEEEGTAPAISLTAEDRQNFLSTLPFTLTRAQNQVMEDIEKSLAKTMPMSRLVQGDVGSGKTVVAALALFAAARNGYQSALMAPTEVLAQQHHISLQRLLAPLGIRVGLLTGSIGMRDRRSVLEQAEGGLVDVLVGTHALFQEGVEMQSLGVAIVDEQHRFGVEQRSRLRRKGVSPHLLAMTATPIPRTLQLTLYGDLDISVIDELPPGRIPIQTRLVKNVHLAYHLVDQEVAMGRQAFVVCPVIDESLDEDMKSAVAEHKRIQDDVFPNLRVGLLHGRMKAREKDVVLAAFRDGSFHILVATSVVEVGIDIPNATVMVIRDAHRFGLAQLHQLRGRIGRGGQQSYCVLVSFADEGPSLERLQAVVESQDGFRLAEKDLELRGPGDYWGTRQSGLPELRIAGPGDTPVLEMARSAVDMIFERDPDLTAHEHVPLRQMMNRYWSQEAELH